MGNNGRFGKIVRAMRAVLTDTSLTIKLRTGIKTGKNTAMKLVPQLKIWNVDLITMHGRSKEARFVSTVLIFIKNRRGKKTRTDVALGEKEGGKGVFRFTNEGVRAYVCTGVRVHRPLLDVGTFLCIPLEVDVVLF